MRLGFFDTETTGLDQSKGDQIIEFALSIVDSQSRVALDRVQIRIKPTKNISADAQRIHGIAMTDLQNCDTWEIVAPQIRERLDSCGMLIAHNMDFDKPFIDGELQRVGMMVLNRPTYCTMENGRWACFDGKLPKLSELCFALGVEYDPSKAHAAMYDVDVMTACYFKAVDRGIL